MQRDIIQSFWYSKDIKQNAISVIEVCCVASYLANHHPFHLYTYTPNDASMQFLQNAIQKCQNAELFVIKDAREILPESEIFLDDRGSVGIAAFSDFFRFNLLYQKGNWWVDMDTICIQPLIFDSPYVFASQREGETKVTMATTCVIKAPKHSDFLSSIIQISKNKIKNDLKPKTLWQKIKYFLNPKYCQNCKVRWGIIGPTFLDNQINQAKMQRFISPPNYFCQIDWDNAKAFVAEHYPIDETQIYVMHVWNAMWGYNHLSKSATYPQTSIIEKLKKRYLSEGGGASEKTLT